VGFSATFDVVTGVATFIAGHHSTLPEVLTELGFALETPRSTTTTLLDTFDGRLHRAGLRLQVIESNRLELELSGESTTPAHIVIDKLPRVLADLPPGPFKSRIAALIGVRALLPQLRVSSRRTSGVLRDSAGKVQVVATRHEAVQVVDRQDITCPAVAIEIHEVPGYTKRAERILTTLRDLGIEESKTDILGSCANAAGVDLGGFAASATVPLDPEMAPIDGFRLILANLAETIKANWQGSIDQTDPEFLHDLRIAVRRTRTVLANAKQVVPTDVLDHTRDEFSWLADLTSAPRDLDVYLLEWSSYIDPLGRDLAPLLEPVRELLEHQRADAHTAFERGMRSKRATTLMTTWQRWLAKPVDTSPPATPPRRPLGPLVAKRIARANEDLLERGRLIGPATPAEKVHDLRKDAKELRYLLECFGSLLPAGARKRYVRRLKALQDNLGEHQDAEVHVNMLRTIAHELHATGASADTMLALGQLTELLDQRRRAARAEFAERFARYDTPATQRALDAVLEGIGE